MTEEEVKALIKELRDEIPAIIQQFNDEAGEVILAECDLEEQKKLKGNYK